MKVLVISSNRLMERFTITEESPGGPQTGHPAFSAGPAYIAGATRDAGHEVEVFDCLFARNLDAELTARIRSFNPDVIALSIRYVHAVIRDKDVPLKTVHLDLRPQTKEIVDCIKAATSAVVLVGGPGFNYYAREWLRYLDLDYGIRGEGEIAFPLYLDELEKGGDIRVIPGCIYFEGGEAKETPRAPIQKLDATPLPAFDLCEIEKYRQLGTLPVVLTKRGCRFNCDYCLYRNLEGNAYRLKSPERVAREVQGAIEGAEHAAGGGVYFCDNLFNCPISHAEAICRQLAGSGTAGRFGCELTPLGVTEEFAKMLAGAGCKSPDLAIEFATPEMLKRRRRGYGIEDIVGAANALDGAGLSFMVSLLLGGPGETPDTIEQTFDLLDSLPRPELLFVTVGMIVFPGAGLIADARKDGQLADESTLFDGSYYMSPALDEDFLKGLSEKLEAREDCMYWIHKAGPDKDLPLMSR